MKKFSFGGLLIMKDGFIIGVNFLRFFYVFRKLQFIKIFIIGSVEPVLFCSIDFKFWGFLFQIPKCHEEVDISI